MPDSFGADDPLDPSNGIIDIGESDKEAAIARQIGVHPLGPSNFDDGLDDPLNPND